MKILETTVKYESKFVNLNETAYVDNVGNQKAWMWAQRPNNTDAVMIAATVGAKLVVVREFRVPMNDYEWGFPAGLIDKGESPLETASREFEEETGLKITRFVRDPSPLVYNSPGLTDEGIYIVFANADGKIDSSKAGDSEDITVHLLDQKEVRNLVNDPTRKKGAKAYLIFLYFSKYGTI